MTPLTKKGISVYPFNDVITQSEKPNFLQLILHLDLVLCMSPLLPPANIVVLGESCLILLLCLFCAGYQFLLYNRHRCLILCIFLLLN